MFPAPEGASYMYCLRVMGRGREAADRVRGRRGIQQLALRVGLGASNRRVTGALAMVVVLMGVLSIAVFVADAAVGGSGASPSATAGKPDGTCGLCVLAPSGQSLTLSGNGSVSLSKANVVVNSNGRPAVSVNGNGSLVAPSVGVVGTVFSGKGTIHNLTTGITPIADPLAGLEVPSLPVPNPVPSVSLSGQGSRTINPGVYDEISVTGKSSLTLAAGTYVISRQLTATGNANLTAQGVTIYLACSSYPTPCKRGEQGASLSLTGKGSLKLSGSTEECAPVAIFSDRNSTAPLSLTGDGNQSVDGMIYAKSGALTLTGNGSTFAIGGFVDVGSAMLTGNGNISIAHGFPLSEGLALSLFGSPTSARVGETEVLSASLTCHGKPLTGQSVAFAVTGANPNHGIATTNSFGNATFSYKGLTLGTDAAQASFTAPGIGVASTPVTIHWSKAQPSISTSVSDETVEVGKAVTDTARVSGGFSPSGMVSWNVYAASDTACKTPLNGQSFTASLSNGSAQSPAFTPNEPGTYQFVASYGGDAKNDAASAKCGAPTERVFVSKAQPSISTKASATVTLGKTINDTATLTGGSSPGGTVSFNVYASSDTSCRTPLSGKPLTASLNNGRAQSPDFKPAQPGTYQFVASYAGDTNNRSATTSCGDGSEQVTVTAPELNAPISTTAAHGDFYAAESSAQTFTAKPGDTPAFAQDFPTINFNPPAGTFTHTLQGLPKVDPSTRPFTDVTTDEVGNGTGVTVAQGNGLQAGLGSLESFDAVLTATFVVSQASDVTFNVVADDGFLLGVCGGATSVSGKQVNPPSSGSTPFKSCPLMGAFNESSGGAPKEHLVTIHFPTAGSYPYELDYFECCGHQLSLTMKAAAPEGPAPPFNLFAGYADTVRPAGTSTFPFPWQGSENTTFVGSPAPDGTWDTGGLRFDNVTGSPIILEHVTVDIGSTHFDPGFTNIMVPPKRTAVLAGTGQLVSGLPTGKGGIYITGHDPDYHAYQGGNAAGAQNILKRAVNWVTFGKANPKMLLVTDLRNPGGDQSDPRNGLTAAGFTYDIADDGSSGNALDLHTVDFTKYSVVVVASDYGGWLRQEELDILNARSADIISYINGGGGLVALAECGCRGNGTGTTHDRFGFLPSVVSSAALNQGESGFTLTSTGTAMGLATSDINGNASHNIFTASGGLDTVDLDSAGHIISLAERGQQVGTSNFDTSDIAQNPLVSSAFDNASSPLSPSALQNNTSLITPVDIATGFDTPIAVDYYQPLNEMLLSANYSSGQPNNFDLVDETGAHSQFTTVAGLTDEVYMAAIRPSTCEGGFTVGDVFVGTGRPGEIARISDRGATFTQNWVELPGETGLLRGGLFQDRYCAFGGDLIVTTTAGDVWRVTSAGAATELATHVGDTLEGPTTVPDDPRYGPWASTILVSSEGCGCIESVDSTGKVSVYAGYPSTEGVQIVPAGQNFFGVDFGEGKLVGVPAAQLTGFVGDVFVDTEFPGSVIDVRWDPTANGGAGAFIQQPVINPVSQFEGTGFGPVGVANLPPPECSSSSLIPQIHVTSGGVTTTFTDDNRILTHGGLDAEACGGVEPKVCGTSTATPYPQAVLADHPTVFYRLDESQGPTACDSSGAGHDATYASSGVTYEVPGAITSDSTTAIANDGNQVAASRTDGVLPTGTQPRTIELWEKTAEGQPTVDLVGYGSEGTGRWVYLDLCGGTPSHGGCTGGSSTFCLCIDNANVKPTFTAPYSLADDSWHQLTVTYDGVTTLTAYVDGRLVGSDSLPEPLDTVSGSGLAIGGALTGTITHFNGSLDEVAIYPTALSAERVAAHYAAATGNKASWQAASGLTPDQVCPAWKLEVPSGAPPPTLSGGSLQITNTSTNQPVDYNQEEPNQTLSVPDPLVIEARMRFVSGTTTNSTREPANIGFATAPSFGSVLQIGKGLVFLTKSETERGATASVDTSSFHTYRIEVTKAGSITVFQDGSQILSGSEYTSVPDHGTHPRVYWGNGSKLAYGVSQWQFVRHNAASCATATVNESHDWVRIAGTGTVERSLPPATTLTLTPAGNTEKVVDQSQTVKVAAMNQTGQPVGAGVPVTLSIAGTNGQTLTSNTDNKGVASFSYVGSKAGIDTLSATALVDGLRSVSNTSSLAWNILVPGGPVSGTGGTAPPFVSIGAPSDGSTVSSTTPITATVNPPANQSIASWKVTAQNVTGGSTTELASGKGTPPSPIATFDPSGLKAGTYAISVSATSSSGGTASAVTHVIVGGQAGAGTGEQAPPEIGSIGPPDGTEVKKPVPVTASIAPPSGQTITSWSVSYQGHTAGSPLVTLNSGLGTPPATLATFDPTQLPNDTYNITVSATASGGGRQSTTSTVAVLGNLKLGRYVTTYQDLSVPVNGFQMQVRRVYDSIDKRMGDFGVGWHVEVANFRVSTNRELGAGGWSEYGTHCFGSLCLYAFKTSVPHYVTITYPDGHQEVFDFTPEGGDTLFSAASPAFKARPDTGTTSELAAINGGGALGLTASGDLVEESGNPYNPTRFRLTTHQGTVLVLDVDSGLVSETDRNGNKLEVTPKGLESSNGQSIVFTRDSQGRITKIVGPSGQNLGYAYSSAGDLASSTDPDGHTTTYSYDAEHHLEKATGPGGQALQTLQYNEGRLESVTDANGNTTKISTNVADRQQTETDPNGKLTTVYTYDERGDAVRREQLFEGKTLTTKYTYDGEGRPTGRTDPLGHTWSAEYDGAGDITKLTLPSGHSIEVTYDSFGDPLTETDALGNTTSYAYDSSGNVTSVTDPLGHTKGYAYGSAGRIVSITDREGNTTTFTYDAAGNLASKTNPLGQTTTYTHDASGNLISVTDPLGHTTSYTYDEVGSRTSQTDPLGRRTTYSYDALNHPVSRTGPAGRTTRWSYTGAGQLASEEDPVGGTTRYTYDADGNLTSSTDPRGAVTAYAYDGLGRLTGHTDPLDRATAFAHDADGNLTGATDPAGHTTHLGYDDEGRLTGITDPLGNTTSYAYDADGNVTSSTDQLGHTTTYAYDAAGRPITSTDPLGHTTTYTYDPNGLLSALTDALGGTVKLGYDATGNEVSLTEPDGNTTTYAYDAAGNPIKTTDPLGRVTTHTYDQANELTSTTDGRGITATYAYDSSGELASATVPGQSVSFTHDALGRRTSMSDSTGTTTYGYDPAGDVTSVAAPAGTISYTYDLAGQRQTMTLPGSRQVSYSYDATSNLASIEDWLGSTTRYGHDAAGQQTSITRPNGVNTSIAYDADGQITSLEHNRSGVGPIVHYTYGYDADGNRASATTAAGTESFSFDALNRLTGAQYPNGDLATYAYDPAGNRTSSTLNGTTTKASYDAAGELTANGSTGYAYNGDGGLLSAGSSSFSWDPLGRLARATVGGQTTTYAYDGDGLRASATTGSTTTPYLWDTQGELPQLVDDGTNGYVQDEGVQEQINRSAGAATVPLADALGSIQTLTDATGNVTSASTYDAFGNPRSHSGESMIFGYAGQQTDPTGLQYLRSRYLDSSAGRFISPDSIQPSGPGTQGYNRCTYTQDDPTTFTDPSGHLLAEYAPLLPEQLKRGEALGSINRCLGVALIAALNGEITRAESLVPKAFEKFKDVVPYGGIASAVAGGKVTIKDSLQLGSSSGSALRGLFSQEQPGRVVTLPVPGFDPEIQNLTRNPWGAPEKPRLGDNLGAQIHPTIIADNRPSVWSMLGKLLGIGKDVKLGKEAYDYFALLAKLQCEPNEPSGERNVNPIG
jgi:RHS repeat-associated protein